MRSNNIINAVKPIKQVYKKDSRVNLDNTLFMSKEGLKFYTNNLTLWLDDIKINNHSTLMLTSRRTPTDFMDLTVANSTFPQTFTTYLTVDYLTTGNPSTTNIGEIPLDLKFWCIEELSNEQQQTRDFKVEYLVDNPFNDLNRSSNSIIPNTCLFQIELLDDNHCVVTHDDTYVKTYLTYDNTSSATSECSFQSLDSSIDTSNQLHPQLFQYCLTREQGLLVLMHQTTQGMTYIAHDMTGDKMKGTTILDENGWPKSAVLKAKIFPINKTKIDLENNFLKYKKDIDYNISLTEDKTDYVVDVITNPANTLTVDTSRHVFTESRLDEEQVEINPKEVYIENSSEGKQHAAGTLIHSYNDIDTNFFIHAEYNNITNGELEINILPTKNHLTPTGDQSLNNPIPTMLDCDFRNYNKIHSGTNQATGDSDILLGYNTFSTEYTLKSDKLTYFHLPQNMAPVEWMNINWRFAPENHFPGSDLNMFFRDFVGLIESGAIAGASPRTSDRIFKYRGDYKETSPWGESYHELGSWVCTWLRSTASENTGTVINDKLNGPIWVDRYYDPNRFTEVQAITSISTCVDNFVDLMSSIRKGGVADIRSQLRLEPGCQYAYYHIGNSEVNNIIKSFNTALISENLYSFNTTLSTGETSQLTDRSETGEYIFDGSSFGTTISPVDPYKSFYISFWLSSDDWTKPAGYQLLGNYTNDGIGLFNDERVTPIGIADIGDSIEIVNSDLVTLSTIISTDYAQSSTSNIFLNKFAPVEDFIVIENDHQSSKNIASKFNCKGILTETINLTSEGSTPFTDGSVITSTCNDEQNIYTSFNTTTAIGIVDIKNETCVMSPTTPLSANIYHITNNTQNVNSIKKAKTGEIYTTNGSQIEISSDNTVYYLLNDKVYKYHKSMTGTSLSASGYQIVNNDTSIDQIKIDHNDCLWVVNDRYITKLDSTNKLLFEINVHEAINNYVTQSELLSSSLSAADFSGDNCLDFISEYTPNGLEEYALIQVNANNTAHGAVTICDYSAVETSSITLESTSGDFYNLTEGVHWNAQTNNSTTAGNITSAINNNTDGKFVATQQTDSLDNIIIIRQSTPGSTGNTEINLSDTNNMRNTNFTGGSEGIFPVKLNLTGDVISVDHKSDRVITYTDQFNLFNFSHVNQFHKLYNNTLKVKTKLKNKFNRDAYELAVNSFDISVLSPGYHHFAIGLDTYKNRYYLYVDSKLVNPTNTEIVEANLGTYSFTDTIEKVMSVGASAFFNNIRLADYIKQPRYYYMNNSKIKSFRLYDSVLLHDHVRALGREHMKIHDIHWNVPTGERSLLDHVDKFHRHRLPGRKSETYDIKLYNESMKISNETKNKIEIMITDEIRNQTPVNSELRDIQWK